MKHNKLDFVDSQLANLKQDNLYRKLRYATTRGSTVTINKKRLVNLGSNDYLGIIPAEKIRVKQLQSSSRLVAGNDESYKKLEDALARHKSQQGSLIYPTGYMANMGAISAVAKKGDLILSDELNHASIIESCKLTGASISIYRHNDMQDLRKKIRQRGANKFVICEGVFSMDGDLAPLKQITEISDKSGALTIVDDAHGDFVMGRDGKGTPDHFKVGKKIDVYTSSLSKGLGSFGGYVSSRNNMIDLCINKSKSFIYTSALPSFLIEHSLKRFQSDRETQRRRLIRNTEQIKNGLLQLGYDISSATQIIPIIAGDEKKSLSLGKFLFDNGVFAQPIRYPTVPKNQARLRISVTAWLSDTQIQKVLRVFEKAHQKFFG